MSLLENAKWNAFSQSFKIIVQLINIVYLARIIPPSEYGIMAMALVVINFGILLRDLGTAAAIIQRETLTSRLINTVFWLNTLMGITIGIVIIAISSPIASIYEQPKLFPVLCLLSVIFPLSSCASAHQALLERESKFKKISMVEVTSSLFSVCMAIVLANMGYGVYSLVFQAIVMSFMSACQYWIISVWRPSIKEFISIAELKSIFGFSANLSLFNFINYFSRNTDSFIIGKYMSAAILGSYSLAYRIMLFPLQSLTFVATRSLYPVLSKNQNNNKEIAKTYLNCIFAVLFITMPLMSGIALLSQPFVNLVFGSQWWLTADILTWLAPTAIIQSVLSTTGSVFMAKGRTDILMRLGIVGTILQVGAFFIGANYNIIVFAKMYFIANIINFFPVMFFLLKLIDSSFSAFFNKILSILISSVAMIIFLKIIIEFFVVDVKHQSVISLFLTSCFGAVFYFLSMFVFSKSIRDFSKKIIKRFCLSSSQ
ncbi:MOP flippase family protein [Pectobacterium aroidearum]|uniref:MOP flippase family protein n=1 Tax=Pectobacterium aroidearum TaxID=1201031 RepID=UPI0015F42DCE|nr:MOP flippase family protein [Pectobacterium aroidearum]MBA5599883.1 MOP flippase family protein [Pectobacterium aroidearum]